MPNYSCFSRCLACVKYQDETYSFNFLFHLSDHLESWRDFLGLESELQIFFFIMSIQTSYGRLLIVLDEFGNGIYLSWVYWSPLHVTSPLNTRGNRSVEDIGSRLVWLTLSCAHRSWNYSAYSKSCSYRLSIVLKVHNKQWDGDYVSTLLVLQFHEKWGSCLSVASEPPVFVGLVHTLLCGKKTAEDVTKDLVWEDILKCS